MSTIDDVNYARDRRNCGPSTIPVIEDEDGNEIELPTKWAVCDVCEGRGKHVNPAIDCNGLGADDFEDDPDFMEDYRSGVYDVVCNKCGGRTTVLVVDLDRCSTDILARLKRQAEYEAEDRAIRLAELRAGA